MPVNIREAEIMNAEVSVVVHRSWDELQGVQGDWNHLVDSHPASTLFQRFEWLEAWWKVFGQDRSLYVLGVYENEKLIGAAPLYAGRRSLGFRKITELAFLGNNIAEVCQVIAAPGRESEVHRRIGNYLKARPLEWDTICLQALPVSAWPWWKNTGLTRCLAKAGGGGEIFSLKIQPNAADGGGLLKRKLRKKYQHQQQVLDGFQIKHYRGAEITPAVMAELEAIERSGFRPQTIHSLFGSGLHRMFHQETLFHSALQPAFHVAVLYLGTQPEAYVYGFRFRDRLIAYCSNYRQVLREVSVGGFLHLKMFQQAMREELGAIDLLQGVCGFKKQFHSSVQHSRELTLFHSPLLQRVYQGQHGLQALIRAAYTHGFYPMKKWATTGWLSLKRVMAQVKKIMRSLYVHQDYLILRKTLRKNSAGPAPEGPALESFEIRELKLKDIALFQNGPSGDQLQVVVKRFWKHERCWGVVRQGGLVGQTWITPQRGQHRHQEPGTRLKNGELCLYDEWVDPALRGQGLPARMLHSLLKDTAIHQANQIVTRVLSENDTSLRALQGCHFHVSEHIRRLSIAGIIKFQRRFRAADSPVFPPTSFLGNPDPRV
jgi:CelD/BcsL family acetyltransferase involved in cellulose biosynthesis/GNAT superfamily N-acetyltransferase